jgi:hypothetical protein
VTRRLNVTRRNEVIGTIDYTEIVLVRVVVAMLSATVLGLTGFILWSN